MSDRACRVALCRAVAVLVEGDVSGATLRPAFDGPWRLDEGQWFRVMWTDTFNGSTQVKAILRGPFVGATDG